jgi:predicted nucleic acid-binding protein
LSNGGVYWTDANVLLRFLTDEPPELAARAAKLLEGAQRGELSLKVHSVVVAETVWVLQSFYGYSKQEISAALVLLLVDHGLKVEGSRTVTGALESMAEMNVDFVDALLAQTARSRGEGVASFDADFRKLDVGWHEPGT